MFYNIETQQAEKYIHTSSDIEDENEDNEIQITSLAVGTEHFAIVNTDQSVSTKGSNKYGQLGLGNGV